MQTANISKRNAGGITVSGPDDENGVVVVVLYDPNHYEVPISRGENGGRTLPHSHVVKDVKQIGKWTGGSQDFELPHLNNDGPNLAVLVHAGLGRPILGAARIGVA